MLLGGTGNAQDESAQVVTEVVIVQVMAAEPRILRRERFGRVHRAEQRHIHRSLCLPQARRVRQHAECQPEGHREDHERADEQCAFRRIARGALPLPARRSRSRRPRSHQTDADAGRVVRNKPTLAPSQTGNPVASRASGAVTPTPAAGSGRSNAPPGDADHGERHEHDPHERGVGHRSRFPGLATGPR